MTYFQSKNKFILVILSLFGILYCSVSLINHYNFRTYAYDLGINNNAIYDYAHFRWNDCMILQPQFENVLSDHFSLLPLLISPFYWLFGSYTMLIFQIAGILFGGLGIYKYFLLKSPNNTFASVAMIHFFSIWGIYSALAFDYHDNVMAAMFVPWFILFFEMKSWKKAILFFLLICISKENMALWAIFISLGLMFLHLKEKDMIKAAGVFAIASIFYFLIVVRFIIPALANDDRVYLHFNYEALGNNFSNAITTILTRPRYTFSLLFENHINDPNAIGIKSELHFMILLSGGIALILKPQYLFMLIPIYAQKLFNDDFAKWGLNSHYSIEFVPVITLALFHWLSDSSIKNKILIGNFFCIVTLIATISSLDSRVSKWYVPVQSRFYSLNHYKTSYDVQKINDDLKLIPGNAKVSASSPLVPHLGFRDFIYQFPVINDADYIILFENGNTYPLSDEDYSYKKGKLIADSINWSLIQNQHSLLIFKKIRH